MSLDFIQLLLIITLAAISGAWVFYQLATTWIAFRRSRRLNRGIKAEAKAEAILRRHGYRVLSIQPSLSMTLFINSLATNYQIRPDGIAVKNKKKFLFEVKTGEIAPDILCRETRRQLLEYYYSGTYAGVLLVDADTHQIQCVTFPKSRPTSYLKTKLAGSFAVGFSLAYFLMLYK